MDVGKLFHHPDTLVLHHPVLKSEFPVRNFHGLATGKKNAFPK
jgi:hypothetical protein